MQAKSSLEWTPDLKTKVKTWFLDNRKSYTWIRGQLKSEGYGEVSRSAVAGVLNRMGVARHGGEPRHVDTNSDLAALVKIAEGWT